MSRTSRWIGPALAWAVVAPAVSLHQFTPEDRTGPGLTAIPFGWRIVMIVHLVASLPFGVISSTAIVRSGRPVGERFGVTAWASAGIAAIAAVMSFGENAASIFDGFLARSVFRTIVAFMLTWPWLMALSCCGGADHRVPISALAFAVALVVAFVPPFVYAVRLAESRSVDLESHLSTGRLVKARSDLVGLRALGFQRGNGESTSFEALQMLDRKIALMNQVVSATLPASTNPSARLQRAYLLIRLERLEEAEPILRSLAHDLPDAMLLLGAIQRDQSRWSDAELVYREAVARLLARTSRDPGIQERLITAYEGWADAARSGSRPEVSEAVYREALGHLPRHVGYFSLRLGRHYLSGGRHFEAIHWLEQAVRRDPTLEPQVGLLLREARTRTPACLIGPGRRAETERPSSWP